MFRGQSLPSGQAITNPVITGGTINGTVIGGTTPAAITGTTITATGVAKFADGTAAAPSIAFANSATTGLYRSAADILGVAIGGKLAFRFETIGASENYIATGANNTPYITSAHASSSDVGLIISSKGASPLQLCTQGQTEQARIGTTASANRYITLTGSNGGDPIIGTSAGQLALAAAGTVRARVNAGPQINLGHDQAIPAGGTAGFGYVATSTSNFGIFFGSGAPSLSAAKGSLYLRSDGDATNNRFYINTDGGTTWSAGTTAA
jgi:hypothetical protein